MKNGKHQGIKPCHCFSRKVTETWILSQQVCSNPMSQRWVRPRLPWMPSWLHNCSKMTSSTAKTLIQPRHQRPPLCLQLCLIRRECHVKAIKCFGMRTACLKMGFPHSIKRYVPGTEGKFLWKKTHFFFFLVYFRLSSLTDLIAMYALSHSW